jgi:hypothetical protein
MLAVAGGSAILGLLLTFVLPEPSQRSLEDLSSDHPAPNAALVERAAGEIDTSIARTA